MKKYLFAFAFALIVSVIAIGTPEPERQNQEIVMSDVYSLEIHQPITIQTNENFTEMEAVNINIGNTLDHGVLYQSIDGMINSEIDNEIRLGELIVEKSKKPKDRYILPIWDYKPSIEPPANQIS